MSKKFKGKTCAYSGAAGASETGDHVLAREFVPVAHRGQIPKIPACKACNKEKSDLEHYLTSLLAFGGRHADAVANLSDNASRRLAKNQKLHRELTAGRSRVWTREPSGLLVHSLTIPIDGERVEKLVGLIVRGLLFHHWGVVLGSDCFVEVLSLTARGEAFYDKFDKTNARQRVQNDIGNGALVYSGAQGIDNPQVSVWEVSLYGGVKMSGDNGRDFTSKFGIMTGPTSIKKRAEERVKRGTIFHIS